MANRVFKRLRRMKLTFQNALAWCMILALMGANACVLRDLFYSLNWHIIDAVVCAIAVAVIVDGLPTFVGLTISRGEGKRKWFLILLAAMLSIFAAVMVCCLRYMWFCDQADAGTISVETVWEVYSQYFLMILPLLTSTTAFVIAVLMHHIPADQLPEDPEIEEDSEDEENFENEADSEDDEDPENEADSEDEEDPEIEEDFENIEDFENVEDFESEADPESEAEEEMNND